MNVGDLMKPETSKTIAMLDVVDDYTDSQLRELGSALRRDDLLFHSPRWRPVFAAYGLTLLNWGVRRDGRLVAALPVVEQSSFITGHQLVSLPWFDAAGIISVEEEATALLVERLRLFADDRKCPLVQLRQRDAMGLSRHVRTDKLLMRLKLESNGEVLWKRLDPKVRNQVRKSEKSGVTIDFGGQELLKDFFAVYSENMRDLGSPSHSLGFFEAICAAFRDEVTIIRAMASGRVVGAGFTLANGPCLEIPWASSVKDSRPLCVNHGMYWKILERACGKGFEWFYFGRSSVGSGQHHFKQQWGAEEVPLHWYLLSGDEKHAEKESTPPGEKMGLAVKMWKKLPLPVSRWLGPKIIAQIP